MKRRRTLLTHTHPLPPPRKTVNVSGNGLWCLFFVVVVEEDLAQMKRHF